MRTKKLDIGLVFWADLPFLGTGFWESPPFLGGFALLGDVDGPFQIINRWKTYILHSLTEDYFYNTIKVVRSVSAEQLNSLANTYLKEEDFYELVVY